MKKILIGAILLCGSSLWAGTSNCDSAQSDSTNGCSDVDSTFTNFNLATDDSGIFDGGSSQGPDIVVNGGFETGDLTGWTLTNNVTFDQVCEAGSPVGSGGATNCIVNSGSFAMTLGHPGTETTLSQTLVTTPGDTYNVDFYVANFNPGTGGVETFEAAWNGSTIYSLSSPQLTLPYTLVSMDVMATSSSTTLSFMAENDPGQWFLDDVSASDLDSNTVPEPSSLFLMAFGLAAGLLARRSNQRSTRRI